MAKTLEELSKMDNDQLVEYVASLTKQIDATVASAKKAAEDDKEKEKKEAVEAAEKTAKEAMHKKEAEHKALIAKLEGDVLKAMQEDDKTKREAAVKSAMETLTSAKSGQDEKKDDEEKKAMKAENQAQKAEIAYLATVNKKPKIEYLTKIYQAANVDENTVKEFVAEWEAMTPKQLDAAIAKIKPLAQEMEFSADEEKSPFGFSTAHIPKEFSAEKDDRLKKIDKMSDAELFSGDGGPYQ